MGATPIGPDRLKEVHRRRWVDCGRCAIADLICVVYCRAMPTGAPLARAALCLVACCLLGLKPGCLLLTALLLRCAGDDVVTNPNVAC
jgi:hypothetical protein